MVKHVLKCMFLYCTSLRTEPLAQYRNRSDKNNVKRHAQRQLKKKDSKGGGSRRSKHALHHSKKASCEGGLLRGLVLEDAAGALPELLRHVHGIGGLVLGGGVLVAPAVRHERRLHHEDDGLALDGLGSLQAVPDPLLRSLCVGREQPRHPLPARPSRRCGSGCCLAPSAPSRPSSCSQTCEWPGSGPPG